MAEVECTLVQYAVVSYIPVDGGGGEGEFVDVDVGPLLPPPPPQGQRGQVLPTYVRSSMHFFCVKIHQILKSFLSPDCHEKFTSYISLGLLEFKSGGIFVTFLLPFQM